MQRIIIDFGTLTLFGHELSLRIYGYGLMMVLGFLTAIFLAQWRARRSGESPDAIAYCGLLALVGGILGARIAYVIQPSVWKEISRSPNVLGSILDVTSGGLVYYGGVVLATMFVLAYLALRRLPIRRYLDIVAVSLMVGLAFGRTGCLLNGCCFGGECKTDWFAAQTFPMYSAPLVKVGGGENPYSDSEGAPTPPFAHQLEKGQIVLDERLVNPYLSGPEVIDGKQFWKQVPHPSRDLHGPLSSDQLVTIFGDKAEARKLFDAIAGDDARISREEWLRAQRIGRDSKTPTFLRGSEFWDEALNFDTNRDGQLDFDEAWGYLAGEPILSLRDRLLAQFDGRTGNGNGQLDAAERTAANEWLQADLLAMVHAEHSHALKPAQTLGIINALLIAAILAVFYRLRTREGQVFALMLVLYPITRFVLESIRDDNPHNVLAGVLTHNQYTSLALTACGLIMFWVLSRMNPSAGPAWADRQPATTGPKKQSKKRR